MKSVSSPEFVSYMGVGNEQIRIDVWQSEDIVSETAYFASQLKEDTTFLRNEILFVND